MTSEVSTIAVPLLDVVKQNEPQEAELIEAVTEVIRSGRFLHGPAVRELESAVEKRCHVEHAVAWLRVPVWFSEDQPHRGGDFQDITLHGLPAGVVDDVMRDLPADMRGQAHHDRLGDDHAVGEIEIPPHPLAVHFEPVQRLARL